MESEAERKKALAEERVENTRKRIAHAINLLEVGNQELKWACESMGWNEEVTYQVSEAIERLGMALATLTRWDESDEAEA